MTQTAVRDALDKVIDAQRLATLNPEEVPLNVRPGFKFRSAEAQRDLPSLREKLLSVTAPDRLTAVFGEGDPEGVAKAAAILREHDELVLDASKIYGDLADAAEPAFGGDRVFNVTQFALMVASFQDVCLDLGLERLDPPEYREAICFTRQAVIDHIRSILRTVAGDELLIRFLKKQIVDAVVAGDRDEAKIPVFVTGVHPVEKTAVAGLFSKSVTFKFVPGQDITPEVVAGLFAQKKPARPAAVAAVAMVSAVAAGIPGLQVDDLLPFPKDET